MATCKRNKSGGSQSEGASNSASPASSVALSIPSSTQGINNNAPKYGTLVPNRIFVGGISSTTTEAELTQLFSKYGNVKATKIIADRAGVSKGYGFVTFETEEEVKCLIQDSNNIVLKERRLNIAPAIKKQTDSFGYQPTFNRPLDATTPPPSTPNLYFHNGVPYTFHNGMAFFTPTSHQPPIAALPPTDPSLYPSYGPGQNPAPAPYSTQILVPAPAPIFLPPNYPYQPMPMTNGGSTQFIYAGSGSNSGSGSPMAGTPDTSHMPPQMHPPVFSPYPSAQESFYPQIYTVSYSTYSTDYESGQDQQTTNDECSSTVSTPRSDTPRSERSSRSPASVPSLPPIRIIKNPDQNCSPTEVTSNNSQNRASQSNESQIPVVSWQSLQNHAEERELLIRDGRRAFHPIIPPPPPLPPPPQMFMYQQPSFPGNYMHHNASYQSNQAADNGRAPRLNSRNRVRQNVSPTRIPYIPKFPASFNNNNPLVLNNNYHDKKPEHRGRPPRQPNRNRGGNRSRHVSPSPSLPKSNSFSSSAPQMMPTQHVDHRQYERPVMVSNSAPRWANNPTIASHQVKRSMPNKRQNGSTAHMGTTNTNILRLTKNAEDGKQGVERDFGGGGDTQIALSPPPTPSHPANNTEIAAKMQVLSLGTSN